MIHFSKIILVILVGLLVSCTKKAADQSVAVTGLQKMAQPVLKHYDFRGKAMQIFRQAIRSDAEGVFFKKAKIAFQNLCGKTTDKQCEDVMVSQLTQLARVLVYVPGDKDSPYSRRRDLDFTNLGELMVTPQFLEAISTLRNEVYPDKWIEVTCLGESSYDLPLILTDVDSSAPTKPNTTVCNAQPFQPETQERFNPQSREIASSDQYIELKVYYGDRISHFKVNKRGTSGVVVLENNRGTKKTKKLSKENLMYLANLIQPVQRRQVEIKECPRRYVTLKGEVIRDKNFIMGCFGGKKNPDKHLTNAAKLLGYMF